MRRVQEWMTAAAMVTAGTLVVACSSSDNGGTAPPATQVFTTFTVTPATVTIPIGATQTLTASARDQNSSPMSGLTVTYTSSDQSKATVSSSGVVTGVAAGTATITATGMVGTVSKTATVNVTVTGSAAQTTTVDATAALAFVPAQVTIARGGTVTWDFAILHNVTFDAVTGAPANIPSTASGSVSRTFATAGTFPYHCTIHPGMSGSVVVTP